MKPWFIVLSVSFFTPASLAADGEYNGSSYKEVRDQIFSDPYDTLPMTKVTVKSFYKHFKSLIFRDAVRTLNDHNDLLPSFQKLVHPVGICLAGTWTITEEAGDYTGYFQKGAEGLIILRASEAMGHPNLGDYRAFGLAGKIFPTTDENEVVKTANFFTVDDLGGTKISDFTKTELTNKPALTLRYSDFNLLAIGAATAKAFNKADSDAGYRPLYQISEAGLANVDDAKTPKFIRLSGSSDTKREVENKDFRDDLKIENFKSGLSFDIAVRDSEADEWKVIGKIDVKETIASQSCDHRLHFNHPKLK